MDWLSSPVLLVSLGGGVSPKPGGWLSGQGKGSAHVMPQTSLVLVLGLLVWCLCSAASGCQCPEHPECVLHCRALRGRAGQAAVWLRALKESPAATRDPY